MAQTPLWLAAIGAILRHTKRNETMQRFTSNPYEQQILAKGRDLPTAPAPKAEYPRTIGARTFATEAEYREALHDFLNGM